MEHHSYHMMFPPSLQIMDVSLPPGQRQEQWVPNFQLDGGTMAGVHQPRPWRFHPIEGHQAIPAEKHWKTFAEVGKISFWQKNLRDQWRSRTHYGVIWCVWCDMSDMMHKFSLDKSQGQWGSIGQLIVTDSHIKIDQNPNVQVPKLSLQAPPSTNPSRLGAVLAVRTKRPPRSVSCQLNASPRAGRCGEETM